MPNRIFGNVVLTFFSKALSLFSNLISIPLLISLLGVGVYGSWTTLSSVVAWIILLDFGLGNGVKNLVAKDSCDGKITKECKDVVKGTLQFFFLTCAVLLCVLLLVARNVKILKWDYFSTFIIYIPFLVTFPLSMGNSVLQGLRLTGFQSLVGTIKPAFWLASLACLVFFHVKCDAHLVSLLFSFSNVIFFLFSFLSARKYMQFSLVDLVGESFIKKAFPLIKMGFQFFLLQLSSILLFNIGNFLNYSYLGSVQTTSYDVVNKIFTMYISMFNLLIAVYWPEIANAIGKRDVMTIRRLRIHLVFFLLLFVVLGSLLIAFADQILSVLSNSQLSLSKWQLLPFYTLLIIQAGSYVGAVFLNAAEKIKGQIVLAAVSSVLVIPISILFFHMGLGIISVPIATCVVLLPTVVLLNVWAGRLVTSYQNNWGK